MGDVHTSSRAFCVAAQYFSLFCWRISLSGLVADEHRGEQSVMEKVYGAGTRVPKAHDCCAPFIRAVPQLEYSVLFDVLKMLNTGLRRRTELTN